MGGASSGVKGRGEEGEEGEEGDGGPDRKSRATLDEASRLIEYDPSDAAAELAAGMVAEWAEAMEDDMGYGADGGAIAAADNIAARLQEPEEEV